MRRMMKEERQGWLETTWIWGTLVIGIVLAVRGHVVAAMLVLWLPVCTAWLDSFLRRHSKHDSHDTSKVDEYVDHTMSDAEVWRSRFAGDMRALHVKRQRDEEPWG